MRCDVTLSSKGITKLIKDLEKYKKSLTRLTKEFQKKLGEAGVEECKARVSYIPADYELDEVTVTYQLKDNTVYIYMSGKEAVFIEFGAGVIHNGPIGTSLHPKGEELGLVIGSYPGQTHADSPHGWYYTDENGVKHRSKGNPAFAPLYLTEIYLMTNAARIAKEVFGHG